MRTFTFWIETASPVSDDSSVENDVVLSAMSRASAGALSPISRSGERGGAVDEVLAHFERWHPHNTHTPATHTP